MYETSYHRAASVSDASSKIASGADAKLLSGGMTLLPTMKARLAAPSDLIDLTHIKELQGVSVSGERVRIAAATTHFDVCENRDLKSACPGLCDLASHIGDPAVRHRGTIGGSVANNDPAADYPAALVALNASIVTDQGAHQADDFFTGLFETALKEGEIIVAVEFDAPKKAAYAKFPNPASRYALAGVFVAQLKDGSVRVGVTGASADGVYRASDMEAALAANWSADALEGCKQEEGKMLEDIHASKAYRAHLVNVMARRAVLAC